MSDPHTISIAPYLTPIVEMVVTSYIKIGLILFFMAIAMYIIIIILNPRSHQTDKPRKRRSTETIGQIVTDVMARAIAGLVGIWLLWAVFVPHNVAKKPEPPTQQEKELTTNQSKQPTNESTIDFVQISPNTNQVFPMVNGKLVEPPITVELPTGIKKKWIDSKPARNCASDHPNNNELYNKCISGYWIYYKEMPKS